MYHSHGGRSGVRLKKLLAHLKPTSSTYSADSVVPIHTSQIDIDKYITNTREFKNWAEIYSCVPQFYHEPTTIHEIVQIIAYASHHQQKVRVLGSGHSPANIAFTNDHLISLNKFTKIIGINRDKNTVKCQAGCRLKDLNEYLEKEGLGLKNLGSISEQTLAGAISTGTHGTGIGYGILATDVTHVQLVNGLGKVVECSEEDVDNSLFKAVLCSLGVLGVLTEITIRVEALKHLDALEYPLSTKEIEGNLEKVISGAEHSRFWWFPHSDKCIVWQANKTDPDKRNVTTKHLKSKLRAKYEKAIGYYSFEAALFGASFVPSVIPILNRVYRHLLFNGPKHTADVTYKVFNFDCLFKQYVTEWAIPISRTAEAMASLRTLIDHHKFKVHYPIEVRFVKGDDIWLSPSYGGDTCWIGIIMYRPYGLDVPYKPYFSAFESLMESLGGRPHWAKVHQWTSDTCRKNYPQFDAFCKLRASMDPKKVFSNSYTERLFD
jgi:L-gulonolactone oxidase